MKYFCLLLLLLTTTVAAAPGETKFKSPTLKQPIKPGLKPIVPKTQKSDGAANNTVAIPATVTTQRLEIIGSPNLPKPEEPFSPITKTTSALEVIGSPKLPDAPESFTPITVNTSPLEVIGTPQQ